MMTESEFRILEEMKDYLRSNLRIQVDTSPGQGGVEVRLYLEGKLINKSDTCIRI